MKSNHSIQRTGASRSAQLRFGRRGWLAPAADAGLAVNTPTTSHARVRAAIALAAGLGATIAMGLMFIFDYELKARAAWVPYVMAAPMYILLQLFAEGVLEGLWSSRRWVSRVFTIVIVVGYYVLWFALTL